MEQQKSPQRVALFAAALLTIINPIKGNILSYFQQLKFDKN